MNEEIRLLTKNDIKNMRTIIEDDNMIFNTKAIERFIEDNHNYAFGVIADNKIVGLAYCYNLLGLDGKDMFYMHSIGFLKEYQDKGFGTKLVQYVSNYAREQGFSEMFVITDKGNPRACRVYEKAGGKNDYEDEIVYVINYD